MITYKQFLTKILEDKEFFDDDAKFYIRKQARRSYTTYKYCLSRLKPGDKILSIGAFHATIEKLLKEAIDVEITVVDFPDSIELQKKYYEFLGLKYLGVDLSKGLEGVPENHYDMIIYTEVIEHIPVAPYEQLQPFDKHLTPGGKVIVTTPNLTSIVHIAKLFMKIPLFAEPEKFFGPVTYENLQIHRREYMPSEITSAFSRMGYKYSLRYFIYNEPKSIQYRMMYIIGQLIPRFREGMLIEGLKIS
jgi:2-polyprenyl-3-methyl-5-hydroxy-6-metoxy-1,4-benzoquinol methylase